LEIEQRHLFANRNKPDNDTTCNDQIDAEQKQKINLEVTEYKNPF
jgi:hypothetical protein